MDDIFRSYWWLLFPIGFFLFGAFDRWLSYKRSRDHLELLRSYTSQGKDPPPELLRAVRDVDDDDDDDRDMYWGDGRRHRRRYRRYWRYRYSPAWQWRTFFTTGAVAAGFWFAAEYADWPGVDGPFRLVAIILTFVAVGHGIAAAFSTIFRDK
jgi:hypothetical protein